VLNFAIDREFVLGIALRWRFVRTRVEPTATKHTMRGRVRKQEAMFVAVSIERLVEQRLDPDHPLRRIRRFANELLASMSDDFERAYSERGRMSVPPECMLKALLCTSPFETTDPTHWRVSVTTMLDIPSACAVECASRRSSDS
jgi:hypothetical protein